MSGLAGGCLCGAIRYETSAPPIGARTCWCRLCQYLAAGSATVNAFFKSETVSISGTLTHFDAIADSGNTIRRGFCPTCGTQVTSAALSRPHLIALRVGTLDNPSAVPPKEIIWTSEAPEWACLNPELPQQTHQPPPVA